jgi:hypothetical protein
MSWGHKPPCNSASGTPTQLPALIQGISMLLLNSPSDRWNVRHRTDAGSKCSVITTTLACGFTR